MVVLEHDNAKSVVASKLKCCNNKNIQKLLKEFEFPREAEMLLLNSVDSKNLTIPKLHGTIERKVPIA